MTLIGFRRDDQEFKILNIYNNDKCDALLYFKKQEDNLSEVTIICGDFNLRHLTWDFQEIGFKDRCNKYE